MTAETRPQDPQGSPPIASWPAHSFGVGAALIVASVSMTSAVAAGDGFYLRGGIGLDWTKETKFTDEGDCSSLSPAALYGCGSGNDGAPIGSLGDFGTVAGIELGLGYAVAQAARLELLVEYRPHFTFEGLANSGRSRSGNR